MFNLTKLNDLKTISLECYVFIVGTIVLFSIMLVSVVFFDRIINSSTYLKLQKAQIYMYFTIFVFGLWGMNQVYADDIVDKRKKDESLFYIYTLMEVLVWFMTFPFIIGIYVFIFTLIVLILRFLVQGL